MSRRPEHLGPRTNFSEATKDQAFMRDRGRCVNCHKKLSRRAGLAFPAAEFDHDNADGFGGDNSLENCKTLCHDCHSVKTKDDTKRMAHADRQGVRTGQQARRKKRDKPLMQSKGFDKTLTKKMDGTVVRRK